MAEPPPGKSCFPQRFGPSSHEWDPDKETGTQHGVRWLQVHAMDGMTKAAFRKQHGFKKTLAQIHDLVAAANGVSPHTIKWSCDIVDAAIEAGTADQFFVGDWRPRNRGKKRSPRKLANKTPPKD